MVYKTCWLQRNIQRFSEFISWGDEATHKKNECNFLACDKTRLPWINALLDLSTVKKRLPSVALMKDIIPIVLVYFLFLMKTNSNSILNLRLLRIMPAGF